MGRTCCTCDGDKDLEVIDDGKARMIDMQSSQRLNLNSGILKNVDDAFMNSKLEIMK